MLGSSNLYSRAFAVSSGIRVMFSFDFSAFDLVLSIGVIVLIALFVTTLVKLNPSGENKEKKKVNAYEEEQELGAPAQDFGQLDRAGPSQTFQQSAERSVSDKLQPPQVVVGVAAGGSSQESIEQAPKAVGYRESSKNHKVEAKKPAPKASEDKDCFHFFGYLGGLPKNTPIPGECFGCQRIVDCLITPKKKP
jgi:hypothetical protein